MMPKSLTHNEQHNDDSDNDFSSANENSNLSEIHPLVLSTQSNLLRQASQLSAAATAFNQNSSSSTSSLANANVNTQINNSNQNSNGSSASANKKFRHQNFSKNIYIGTKNAERWDNLRNLFQFKNDVEFVSFLLTTAENEAQSNKNGFKLPMFAKDINHSDNNSQDNLEKEQSTSQFLQKHQPQLAKPPVETQQQLVSQQKVLKKVKRVQFQDNVSIINDDMSQAQEMTLKMAKPNDNHAQDHSISSTIDGSVSSEESNNTTEILDCRIEEKIKNELEEKQKLIEERVGGSTSRGRYDEAPTPPPISSSLMEKKSLSEGEEDEMEDANESPRPNLSKRRFYDIRKAPMLDVKLNEMAEMNLDKSIFDFKDDDEDDDCEGRLEINSDFMIRDRKMTTSSSVKKAYKSKLCLACNTKHGKESCPIRNPISSIGNQIDFADWIQDNPVIEEPKPIYDKDEPPLEDDSMFYDDDIKSENMDEDDGEEDEEPEDNPPADMNGEDDSQVTFADASLPNEFQFLPSMVYPTCGKSVFTKILIPKYTQIGPLVGVVTPETDIPDDCNFAHMFEIHDSILSKSIYFNMENKQKSNWVRYLQPARARDQRNLTLVKVEDKIYFVSSMDIDVGCELLYWSDDINSAWGKKKVEKTNCGGCNLRFDHPLYYRTHCSVFHDPGFSLTIRKYHCKICGVAVLGKDNIMKHAEKLHDGKGAYQCQYCKKFFLRLNYLEMHRTYGCAANPQRTRPLCDFCGRKFCQPQKLKVHIKRMHSDMAEVLRDFQCKLCSKLLGSRAALQRHSKEVHSRNSAVVSCPRCQKLFQNRSNLKIHMLTHSGVRPFKCAENECAAAFTTKQCLQFHYKKVHGFTQEQMPKIERSVAYTFDAYSGGLKNEALEGMTRRQRKNLGESLNKATRSMQPREKEMILKDKSFLTSITDLCKSENNLNLLSSKISSILNCNLKEMNKKLMNNGSNSAMDMDHDEGDYRDGNDFSDNMNVSDLEGKMMDKNMGHLIQPKRDDDGMLNDSISGNDTNDMEPDEDEDDDESDRNSFKAPINRRSFLDNPQLTNPRFKDFLLQSNPNLVISKGSKKWISNPVNPLNDMDDNDANMMTQANRDFLAKLISSKLKGGNQGRIMSTEGANERSPVLEVVDSNLHQQQQENQFNHQFSHQNAMVQGNNMMEIQSQFQNSGNSSNQNNFNSHFNHLGSFYNGTANVNRNMSGSIPTSASLLVEAALSSVSNMIGSNDINDEANNQQMNMDSGNHQQDLPDEMNSPEFQASHNMMSSVDDNLKMMKSQNFPIHLPSMASFGNSVNSNMIAENSEIEVETSSTPKSHEKLCSYTPSAEKEVNVNSFQNQTNDSCSPARTMTPDQHNANYNINFASHRNTQVPQIQTSPVEQQLSSRPMYGSEHDLVSPASTPSLPRYDFGSESYRRREKNLATSGNLSYQKSMQNHQQSQQQIAQHISSDEENSIVIAENLSVNQQQNQNHIVNDKIKLNSQIDLLYANNSKYDNSLSAGNQSNQIHRDLNDLRLKYNEQGLEIQEFSRNAAVNENVGGGGNGSDYQGLDMSSRAGLNYHSHSFQLSSAAGSNLSFNRYQHHIYDILTDREQAAQNQQQQEHHPFQLQQQQQQIQHLLQDHISHDQDSDQIQSGGVDLSRTSNYIVPPSSPHLPYSHTHSEMLRMASLDLSSGSSGASAMVSSNSSHHVRHHSPFLTHAPNRELPEHHRFLTTADQRLLVDPTAHLLLEQNNRLLSSENNRILDQPRLLADGPVNRHVVSPRGFGAYHHHPHHSHHQVKYHQGPSPNQQQNYHPFSASYY